MNPTTEEIVKRLREHADAYEGSVFSLELHRAADLLEALEAAQPRWISVEERLPEEGKLVLIFVTNPAGWQCITTDMRHEGEWLENCDTEWHNVTHWMPLPEPPKEE